MSAAPTRAPILPSAASLDLEFSPNGLFRTGLVHSCRGFQMSDQGDTGERDRGHGRRGLAFGVGINTLTVDLRYALGLQKIEKSTKAKNKGLTFGLGFMVPIGR